MSRIRRIVFPLTGIAAVAISLAAAEPATTGAAAIGCRSCLFLDDRFIAEQSGFKRVWHQGKPRSEVAIAADAGKWERWPHLFGSVFRDPKDGLYKMYYESAISPARPGDKNSLTCYICYAESKDGKTWTKPKLGLWDDLGSKENNIVIPGAELANVFVDPLETDPTKRLKMFVYLAKHYPDPKGGIGECLLSSADGLRWKFERGFERPAYEKREYAVDFTDTYFFMWDSLTNRYRSFIRTFAKSHVAEAKDRRRRAIGVTESKALFPKPMMSTPWAPIKHVLAADERDDAAVARMSKDRAKPDWAELYCMNYFNYGNHYIGLLSLLYFIDGSDFNGGGDLQLTFSHDASSWHRQPERQTLIGPSKSAPELFPTYVTTNEPLEIGDELWLYYTEANGAHPIAASVGVAKSQIRAATWRKDGFVSLDADGPASLTSKLLKFDGKRLVINAQVRQGGMLRVALLDEAGKSLPGFDAADCDGVTGDHVAKTISWKSKTNLSSLKGKAVKLRIDAERCRLFSFHAAE